MKKTAELPVAESVKLCIELDEEMQEQWDDIRNCIEHKFKYHEKASVQFTDSEIFKALLGAWESEDPSPLKGLMFVWSLSEEEIRELKERTP
jgi:hypothetical protein